MSNKHNGGNNGGNKTPQPNQPNAQAQSAQSAFDPQEEQFRKESQEAMSADLMTVGELAPSGVKAALPTPAANRGDNAPRTAGSAADLKIESDENPQQKNGKSPAGAPGSQQILEMVQAGTINVAEAERLLCALKDVAPTQPKELPYIGGADGRATREEIRQAVEEMYGPQVRTMTSDKQEMLEVMGAMVEKIVTRLREPSEEEKAALARRNENRAKLIREQFEMIQQQQSFRDMCPHERATVDGKTHSCITALHNYVDGVIRGTCGLCQDIMEPGHPNYRQVILSHNLAVSSAA